MPFNSAAVRAAPHLIAGGRVLCCSLKDRVARGENIQIQLVLALLRRTAQCVYARPGFSALGVKIAPDQPADLLVFMVVPVKIQPVFHPHHLLSRKVGDVVVAALCGKLARDICEKPI